jgi:hypothetical protein
MGRNDDTVCISCVFAQWDENQVTQIGCSEGMLEKFQKRGANVIDCFNDNYEFNVIKDRQCPNKRTKKWKSTYGNLFRQVLNNENALRFVAVIFANGNLLDLKRTVTSLVVQELLPQHIVVVNKFGNMIRPKEITEIMTEMDFPWRLENQLQPFTTDHSLSYIVRATEKTCSHLAVFFAGDSPSLSLLDQVNSFTMKELFMYGAIIPNHDDIDIYVSGTIIPTTVFKYWGAEGDPNNTVLRNMRLWEADNHKLIYSMQEVQDEIKS